MVMMAILLAVLIPLRLLLNILTVASALRSMLAEIFLFTFSIRLIIAIRLLMSVRARSLLCLSLNTFVYNLRSKELVFGLSLCG